MDIEKIKNFIDILPSIFIYIVPGYIYIQTYNYVFNLKAKDIKNYIYEYIMISFIINSVSIIGLNFINYKFTKNYSMLDNRVQLVICFISLVLGYLSSKLVRCNLWSTLMGKLGIGRNNEPNIFSDLMDYENGNYVRAYLSSEKLVYYGSLDKFHCEGSYNEAFIMLTNYTVQKYAISEVDDKYLSYFKDKNKQREREYVYLKFSQIDILEVIYADGSKKLIQPRKEHSKFYEKIKLFFKDDIALSIVFIGIVLLCILLILLILKVYF